MIRHSFKPLENENSMRTELIDNMVDTALKGESISYEQALQLESLTREELDYLFIGTDCIRDRFKGTPYHSVSSFITQ